MTLAKIIVIIIAVTVVGFLVFQYSGNEETLTISNNNNMKITSSAFVNNGQIPAKYTCDGENISPPLAFTDIPDGTLSLALIADDPDAPGGTWLHWTLWNIDQAKTVLDEGEIPEGAVEGRTSFGDIGYGGPCPPSGTHRYFFKLFTLDTILNLSSGASLDELNTAMEGHIIESTNLIGLYERRN